MPSEVYTTADASKELRQGEILSDLLQFVYDSETKKVTARRQRFCLVASQDCYLLRDFEDRNNGLESSINSVLLYPASHADERQVVVGNSSLWRVAKSNSAERFHVLEGCPPDADILTTGVPPLIIDFRKFFSATPAQLYQQITDNSAQRRTVLRSPYREHFQNRAAAYFARVSLDPPHAVD